MSLRVPALHDLEAFLLSTVYQRLFSSTPINLFGDFIRDSQKMLLVAFEWLKGISTSCLSIVEQPAGR